ncbi:myb family transcription factor PHL5-like [Impatiens glandulifera]|uniref:myb family transcription factor PHL5-like n=1 Tax=Impatiens glandulifera TaxID=253017 RepID=UPI001FB0AFDE|nr:myb family transcription factor PHL5-like [Impatiens glandulifera]
MDQLLDSAFNMFELPNSISWSPTLLSSEGSKGDEFRGFSQPNITVAISSPFSFHNHTLTAAGADNDDHPIQKAIDFKQQEFYYNVNSSGLSSSSNSSCSSQSLKNKDGLNKMITDSSLKLKKKKKKIKYVDGLDKADRSRKRIRWTKELHRQFVQCVNVLGGAENATPKAILLMMGSDGLTILHVKSHLQKYRTTRSMQDPAQGKSDKTHKLSQKINPKISNQINQALKMHMDVQKKLQDQLKIQKKLELQIEEQGKQLKQMLMQQYI